MAVHRSAERQRLLAFGERRIAVVRVEVEFGCDDPPIRLAELLSPGAHRGDNGECGCGVGVDWSDKVTAQRLRELERRLGSSQRLTTSESAQLGADAREVEGHDVRFMSSESTDCAPRWPT